MNDPGRDSFNAGEHILKALGSSTAETRGELEKCLAEKRRIDAGLLGRHASAMAEAIAGIGTFMLTRHPKPVTGYVRYYKEELEGIWFVYERAYQDFASYLKPSHGFDPHLEKHAKANWAKGVSRLSSSFRRLDKYLRAASHEFSRKGGSMENATLRGRVVDSLERLAEAWRTIASVLSSIKS